MHDILKRLLQGQHLLGVLTMRSFARWIPVVLLAASLFSQPLNATGQSRPLPKSFGSEAAGADLHTPRTISIALSSRRVDDAVSPVRAGQLVAKMTKAMRKTTLQPISDATAAQLSLEMVIESHERWGQYHSNNDPYMFLLLRDRASQHLLYCGYHRVGFFYSSAALDLLHDLSRRISTSGIPNTGAIASCEAEAKRPADL